MQQSGTCSRKIWKYQESCRPMYGRLIPLPYNIIDGSLVGSCIYQLPLHNIHAAFCVVMSRYVKYIISNAAVCRGQQVFQTRSGPRDSWTFRGAVLVDLSPLFPGSIAAVQDQSFRAVHSADGHGRLLALAAICTAQVSSGFPRTLCQRQIRVFRWTKLNNFVSINDKVLKYGLSLSLLGSPCEVTRENHF